MDSLIRKAVMVVSLFVLVSTPDGYGQIFVADGGSWATVKKFNLDGTPSAGFSPILGGSECLETNASGNLLVDVGDYVGLYNFDGSPLNQEWFYRNGIWGIASDGVGNFIGFWQEAVARHVYYIPTFTLFTSSSHMINTLQVPCQNGLFSCEVVGFFSALDRAGHTFVSCTDGFFHDGHIGEYNLDGTPLNTRLVSGLSAPSGLALDGQGHLFVADRASGTVGEYNLDGTPVNAALISGLSGPTGLALDGQGHLFVANSSSGTVGEYNLDGTPVNASLISGLTWPYRLLVVRSTLLGVDVSKSLGSVDWAAVRDAGQKKFVFIKATSGRLSDEQANLDANVAAIRANAPELLIGAYHFAYPNYTAANSAVNEANHFLSIASDYVGQGFLPPVLDIEDSSGPFWKPSDNMTPDELVQWIKDWAGRVERQTGVTPIIYTGNAYAEFLNGAAAALDLRKYPLWIWTHPSIPTGDPTDILPWTGWKFQQYQIDQLAAVPGIPGYADLDSFNGDADALRALTVHPLIVKFTGVGASPMQPPSNGQFQFQVTAYGSQQVTIQASTDMVTWTDASSVTITDGTGVFTDTEAGAQTQKFYRAKP